MAGLRASSGRGMIPMIMDSTEEYEEGRSSSINKKLNRISFDRIKDFNKHWESLFGGAETSGK